jgi:hypothetical protein
MSDVNSEPLPNPPISKRGAALPPLVRVLIALLVPALAAALISSLADNLNTEADSGPTAVILGTIGLVSWIIGMVWYGIPGMGVRTKRPLFASVGFAVMGWVAFLLFRFVWILNAGYGPAGSTRAFIYLLLFESFATQIWTFGLVFRVLSDWRGPLTAAIGSGVLFGMVAFLFFQESFYGNLFSLTFFLLWGVFYGIIRLRTGSLLGTVLIQALQSFTAWVVMVPAETPPDQTAMQVVYTLTSAAFLIFIWRLWPKEESDYRV